MLSPLTPLVAPPLGSVLVAGSSDAPLVPDPAVAAVVVDAPDVLASSSSASKPT